MCPESLNRMKPGPRTRRVEDTLIQVNTASAASANEAMAARVAPSCYSLLTSRAVASPASRTALAAEQSAGRGSAGGSVGNGLDQRDLMAGALRRVTVALMATCCCCFFSVLDSAGRGLLRTPWCSISSDRHWR